MLKPAKESIDICIVVGAIDASLAFYERLGLAKTLEVETPYGTVHRLRFGTSLLKLMDPKVPPRRGPRGLAEQIGLRFLSFTIHDHAEACAALATAGVAFEMPRTEVLPGVFVAMVRDPDDNIVELVGQPSG